MKHGEPQPLEDALAACYAFEVKDSQGLMVRAEQELHFCRARQGEGTVRPIGRHNDMAWLSRDGATASVLSGKNLGTCYFAVFQCCVSI